MAIARKKQNRMQLLKRVKCWIYLMELKAHSLKHKAAFCFKLLAFSYKINRN